MRERRPQLPGTMAVLSGILVCISCGRAEPAVSGEQPLTDALAARPTLSDLEWDEIREFGVLFATRQGIWNTCYGSSQGDFRSYLYDLEAVGVGPELLEDMRSSGAYVMAHVSCDPTFVEPARAAAELAQRAWNKKLEIERLKQSGEH